MTMAARRGASRFVSRDLARGRQTRSGPSVGRLSGDRGSIIAEAALLTPFFVTLLFGMLEFGSAYRDYLTVSNASVAGARSAAVQANAPFADWYILRAVEGASAAMPSSQINYVVIYHATASSTGPTASCKLASSAGTGSTYVDACNRFSPTDLAAVGSGTTPPVAWTTSPPTNTTYWASVNRYVLLTAPGPDYIGIYVNASHPWITGLFGSTLTLTSNTVAQIEPQKLNS